MGGNISSQHHGEGQENSSDQDQEVPEGNGFMFCGQVLPAEMCEEVFLYVPTKDLIRSASRVCRYWHHLLTNRKFWLRKLAREDFKLSEAAAMKLAEERDDARVLLLLQGITCGFLPFNSNLIRNPSGKDGFKYWSVRHGGDKLRVECPPVGSNIIPDVAGLPTQHCFVSSFRPCVRSQTISLNDLHIEPWMLDILRPEIKVSEWVSARFDCASRSQTSVKLCSSRAKPSIHNMRWSAHDEGVLLCEWYQKCGKREGYKMAA